MDQRRYRPVVTSRASFRACTWSDDGRLLATLDADPSLWIWNAQDGTVVRRIPLGRTQSWPGCVFAPGGYELVVFGMESGLEVWDAQTGGLVYRETPEGGRIAWAGFTPDGARLIVMTEEGWVRFLEPQGWTPAETRKICGGARLWASQSPDGALLALNTSSGNTTILDVAGWRQVQVIRPGKPEIEACAFLPDSRRLAILYARHFGIWDARTGEKVRGIGPFADNHVEFRGMDLSPRGDQVALAVREGVREHRVWLLSHDDLLDRRLLSTGPGPVEQVAYSPCGRLLAVAGRRSSVLDLETGEKRYDLAAPFGALRSCAWLPTGDLLVHAEHPERCVHRWDPEESRIRATIGPGQFLDLKTCAVSGSGDRLAVAEPGRAISIWDMDSGACTRRLEGLRADVAGLSFAAAGGLLLSLDLWGDGLVWDLGTGEVLRKAPQLSHVWECFFSPGGRILRVRPTPAEIPLQQAREAPGFLGGVNVGMHSEPLAVCADGSLLALSLVPPDDNVFHPRDARGSLVLWGLPGRQERWSVRRPGHNPCCAAFSADGELLVTGAFGNEIILWDVVSGDLVGELRGGDGRVTGLSFSPCGHWLAASKDDGSLRIWSVGEDPDAWLLVRVIRFLDDGWVAFDGRRLSGTPGALEALRFSRPGELASCAASEIRDRIVTGLEHPSQIDYQ